MRALILVALFAPRLVWAAAVASVFGGRVACVETSGVQFCRGDVGHRVPSWDGVPLDANLTLPPAGTSGPYPLIVELHGWSLAKTDAPEVTRALDGYAVLSYTARGFHESCGTAASRVPDPTLPDPDACATRGWIRLADVRYEARDTQYLAALLADEGLVLPTKIGVTGASYGGGQSLILAALRNRVMLPDGTLQPWKSPNGTDMAIAAAAPLIPWSDLGEALTPTGRTLDYRSANPYPNRAGVQKQSWNALLYGLGVSTGFYAPSGLDPDADLAAWNARLSAGEPYDGDAALQHILAEVTQHHSAYYVDDSIAPAPLLIYNAWTDDLFPVDEGLRFWLKTRAKHPEAEISIHFADGFGHPRANVGANTARVDARVMQLFARHLKGAGDAPPPVEVYTQACNGAAEAGPFTAPTWDAIHPGEVRFRDRRLRRFTQAGGSADVEAALDPLNGGPCRTLSATTDPGAATYLFPKATGDGFTLLGSPTVVADLTVGGSFALVAARLWDVAPDRTQTLVSHSFYRPRSDNAGPQVLQLHPNGWHFAAGHRPKLELLGRSVPFGRASNGTFTVEVRRLELRLPVHELPSGKVVKALAADVLPAAAVEPPDAGPPACPAMPSAGCRSGTGGVVPHGGGSTWSWSGTLRAADVGDPRATTGYRLCAYTGTNLNGSAVAFPGGRCGRRPCWRLGRGGAALRGTPPASDWVAADFRLAPHGGKPAIAVSTAAGVPNGRIQLRATNGACWETNG